MFCILGAKGMLGSALTQVLASREIDHIGVTRSQVDFIDFPALLSYLDSYQFTTIVNCAAEININTCETEPLTSYLINTELPIFLAKYCARMDIKFVQVSTDHFYHSEGNKKHTEVSPVTLLNSYAAQKFCAENGVMSLNNDALVLRTSVLGYSHKHETLISWILKTLKSSDVIHGFTDAYTSAIDVKSLSKYLIEPKILANRGIYNLGCDEVYSKYELIDRIINVLELDRELRPASVTELSVARANSCGLSIDKIRPNLEHVTTLNHCLNQLNILGVYDAL